MNAFELWNDFCTDKGRHPPQLRYKNMIINDDIRLQRYDLIEFVQPRS